MLTRVLILVAALVVTIEALDCLIYPKTGTQDVTACEAVRIIKTMICHFQIIAFGRELSSAMLSFRIWSL